MSTNEFSNNELMDYTPWLTMNVKETSSGGSLSDSPWAQMETKKLYTNVFIVDEAEGKVSFFN